MLGYRATIYICLQTILVALLGNFWLVVTGTKFPIYIFPKPPEIIFGFLFGILFYTYITIVELRSLSKIGSARISATSWIILAGIAPTAFAIINCCTAATPLDAAIRFFNGVVTFVVVGGIVRSILLIHWEQKHKKIIITSFGRELFAISK